MKLDKKEKNLAKKLKSNLARRSTQILLLSNENSNTPFTTKKIKTLRKDSLGKIKLLSELKN